MTREEAILKWIMPAIKNTWNEKKCNEILEALEQEPKFDRLYDWLNDMRLGIAPDETTPDDERGERQAQVDVLDVIIEWMVDP